jgi:hypothetical protein
MIESSELSIIPEAVGRSYPLFIPKLSTRYNPQKSRMPIKTPKLKDAKTPSKLKIKIIKV